MGCYHSCIRLWWVAVIIIVVRGDLSGGARCEDYSHLLLLLNALCITILGGTFRPMSSFFIHAAGTVFLAHTLALLHFASLLLFGNLGSKCSLVLKQTLYYGILSGRFTGILGISPGKSRT